MLEQSVCSCQTLTVIHGVIFAPATAYNPRAYYTNKNVRYQSGTTCLFQSRLDPVLLTTMEAGGSLPSSSFAGGFVHLSDISFIVTRFFRCVLSLLRQQPLLLLDSMISILNLISEIGGLFLPQDLSRLQLLDNM